MAAQRAQQVRASTDSLLEFIPQLSPHLTAPRHLSPLIEVLEEAPGKDLRIVAAAPPQHGKSESVKHAIVYWMGRFPKKRFAYCTYSQDRAEYISRQVQDLATEAGLRPEGNLQSWHISNGAEVLFTSENGPFAGYGVDGVLVVDDPHKDRATAESPHKRRRTVEWFDDVARKRVHPGGSIIDISTRWHVSDLSGVLITRGWRYINLKAIAEGETDETGLVIDDPLGRHVGEPIWPEFRPLSFYDEHKGNAYSWYSLFQGEPRPRGGSVFNGSPALYKQLPRTGYRGAYGLDLAYTAKTHADWSICIEGWKVGKDLYVVDVVRKQVDAPSFALTLKAKSQRGWPMRWYASGTEKGAADFLKKQGIPIRVYPPKGDKFVRATAVAAAWNDGRVLLPDPEFHESSEVHWLPEFLDVVQNFTGVADVHDDDVDALAALWDELVMPANVYGQARAHRGSIPRPRS